jgi:hypothetical protein
MFEERKVAIWTIANDMGDANTNCLNLPFQEIHLALSCTINLFGKERLIGSFCQPLKTFVYIIHLIITCQVHSSQSVAFHHKGVCALQHHSNAELPPLRSDGCHSHCALPSLSQPLAFLCLHRRVITQPLDNRSC